MMPEKLEGTKIRNCLKWLVFSGELKAENTAKFGMLIDDDMQLILMNRAAVSLNPQTSIILESDDVGQVEPSFLTRVGIITVSDC